MHIVIGSNIDLKMNMVDVSFIKELMEMFVNEASQMCDSKIHMHRYNMRNGLS